MPIVIDSVCLTSLHEHDRQFAFTVPKALSSVTTATFFLSSATPSPLPLTPQTLPRLSP